MARVSSRSGVAIPKAAEKPAGQPQANQRRTPCKKTRTIRTPRLELFPLNPRVKGRNVEAREMNVVSRSKKAEMTSEAVSGPQRVAHTPYRDLYITSYSGVLHAFSRVVYRS